MKKREAMIVIGCLIILVVGIGGFLLYKNLKEQKMEQELQDYTPQEEISEEQLRQTIVTLYYQNKETKELMPEARKIDVSLLANDPYSYLIQALIEGPKNETLEKIMPDGTKLNKVELKGNTLWIEFSKEFIENSIQGETEEKKLIQAIVYTVTELNEVEDIKILIDGQENLSFKDEKVNFKQNFAREE